MVCWYDIFCVVVLVAIICASIPNLGIHPSFVFNVLVCAVIVLLWCGTPGKGDRQGSSGRLLLWGSSTTHVQNSLQEPHLL